jgi:hypothetical protein
MSQRRDPKSSGRRDELSDLSEVKALAAKARSETGGPVLAQNAAELSGVRPRRDSVIGARLTPPPRATSSELPNWFWGALGCLSVLLVGFGALVIVGRSGKLDAILGEVPAAAVLAPAVPPTDPAAAAPTPTVQELPALQPSPAGEPAPKHVAAREREREAAPAALPKAPEAADQEKAPAAPDNSTSPAATAPTVAAPAATAPSAAAPVAAAPVAADSPEAKAPDPKAPEPKAPAPRPARAAAAVAPKPVGAADDTPDDDQSAPGQDAVEAALDALASRVRGCFVKYQIKGTARVRLVATPAGTADSVNVTGDFEDTPTGLCVEGVVSGAKLPTFKGPPLKLSQSYQLR